MRSACRGGACVVLLGIPSVLHAASARGFPSAGALEDTPRGRYLLILEVSSNSCLRGLARSRTRADFFWTRTHRAPGVPGSAQASFRTFPDAIFCAPRVTRSYTSISTGRDYSRWTSFGGSFDKVTARATTKLGCQHTEKDHRLGSWESRFTATSLLCEEQTLVK